MDPFSAGFIAIMVVLSGIIAYSGDVLGRKIGKSRLKLGNLRPKHTAAILTGLFGAVATLIVILIISAVSSNVRDWIVLGSRARADMMAARDELGKVQKTLDQKSGELDKLVKERDDLSKAALGAKAENARLEARTKGLQTDLRQLEAKLVGFQGRLNDASQRLSSAKVEYGKVQAQLVQVRKESANLSITNKQFEKLNGEIQKRNLFLTTENLQLEKQLESLTDGVDELRGKNTDLEKIRDQLLTDLVNAGDSKKRELAELNAKLQTAQDELGGIQSKLDAAARDLSIAQSALREMASTQMAARISLLVLGMKNELVRVPVPPRLNLAEARSLLLGAIDKASSKAASYGAGRYKDSQDYVAFINLDLGSRGSLSAEQQFQSLLAGLTGGREERVLLLNSLFNTFQGEFVALDAGIYPNPVVYRSGETVLEARFDGKLGEEAIIEQIEIFIRGDLRRKILADGLIPAVGTGQPLGEFSRESLLRLVGEVRSRLTVVRVQFLSATETRAADSLRLDYRLR